MIGTSAFPDPMSAVCGLFLFACGEIERQVGGTEGYRAGKDEHDGDDSQDDCKRSVDYTQAVQGGNDQRSADSEASIYGTHISIHDSLLCAAGPQEC